MSSCVGAGSAGPEPRERGFFACALSKRSTPILRSNSTRGQMTLRKNPSLLDAQKVSGGEKKGLPRASSTQAAL